jgi:hypothetical protein
MYLLIKIKIDIILLFFSDPKTRQLLHRYYTSSMVCPLWLRNHDSIFYGATQGDQRPEAHS